MVTALLRTDHLGRVLAGSRPSTWCPPECILWVAAGDRLAAFGRQLVLWPDQQPLEHLAGLPCFNSELSCRDEGAVTSPLPIVAAI